MALEYHCKPETRLDERGMQDPFTVQPLRNMMTGSPPGIIAIIAVVGNAQQETAVTCGNLH